jgi:hypothetical protein
MAKYVLMVLMVVVFFNGCQKEEPKPSPEDAARTLELLRKEIDISNRILSQMVQNPNPAEKEYLKFMLFEDYRSFEIVTATQDGQIIGHQAVWDKLFYNSREVLEAKYYEDIMENISGVYLAFEKDKTIQEGQKIPDDGILLLPEKIYNYTSEKMDNKIVISIFE